MSLEKELEGVTTPEIDSPDDLIDDTDIDSDDSEVSGDDATAAGSEEGTDDESGTQKKQGRTIENVRGELLRKLREENETTRRLLNQVLQTIQSAPVPTQSKKPETLDDLPVETLESQRGQVPEDKRAEFDSYLIKRRIDEGIRNGLTAVQEEQKYGDERRRANQIAVDRYPELSNRGSQFYAEVNRRLAALDPNHRKYNPRIVLNLAEDVASEQGIQPRKVTPRFRSTGAPSSVRSDKPASSKEAAPNVIGGDKEYDEIAEKLKHAMKGRPFNKERIMKRAAEYRQTLRLPKE